METGGIEPTALTPTKTAISENPRTESGTVNDETQQDDRDLARLIESWPTLPEDIKAQITNLISEHGGDHE